MIVHKRLAGFIFAAGLAVTAAACGGKAKAPTSPSNTSPTTNETSTGSGAMGGATYGGGSAAMPSGEMPGTSSGDPCAN